MDIRLHEAPHFGIALEIGFKSGSGDKLCLVRGPPYEACNVRECEAPLTESQIHHLIGRIDDARHVSSTFCSIVGNLKTVETLEVGTFEVKATGLEEVEPITAQRQTVGERKGILDGQSHVGNAKLRLHAAIAEFHSTVDDAFRMDMHFDLRRTDTEQPLCLNHLNRPKNGGKVRHWQ